MAVRLCAWCSQAREPQTCLARHGTLYSVCRLCFLAEEVRRLGADLVGESALKSTLEDGLEARYSLARTEAEEIAARHASEGQGESQGSRPAEGQGSWSRNMRRSRSRG